MSSIIREQLANTAVETVQRIVRKNNESKSGFREDIKVLGTGCFYGNEYFEMLTEKTQTARLKFFKDKGSFFHGYLSPKHFTMIQNPHSPSGIKANHFFLKKDILPSDALDAIEMGPSFIGCGETCQIGYLRAIQHYLSTDKFNYLFAADSPTPLEIGFDTYGTNAFHKLITRTPFATLSEYNQYIYNIQPSGIEKGQIAQINGIFEYKAKHIMGDAESFIVLGLGEERVTTLGLDADGLTVSEVKVRLC